MKKPFRFCPVLLLLAAALPAPAQLTFTVTATADDTAGNAAQDYVAGQAYTFVYVLTPEFPQNNFYFPGENNDWFEKGLAAEQSLFAAVGGTGLGGTFVDPLPPAGSPFSFVRAYNGNFLGLYAGSEAGDIGVTTRSGATLTHAIASMNLADIEFTRPATYTNPADYFVSYVGEYSAWGGTVGLYGGTFAGATFQVSGVSISLGSANPAAIPEPSAYAGLFGLAALWAAWRRRKKNLKPET